MSRLTHTLTRMGQLVDEFLERRDRGERPDVEEYARRYPELAAVIRQMLPALGLMTWSAGASPDPMPAPPSAPR